MHGQWFWQSSRVSLNLPALQFIAMIDVLKQFNEYFWKWFLDDGAE